MTNRGNFDWSSIASAFGSIGANAGTSANQFGANLGKIIGAGAAIAAGLAAKAAAESSGTFNIQINGMKAVKLDDLALDGAKINALVVAGPDRVIVSQGDTPDITIDGDEAARGALRFALKDGTLAVLSPKGFIGQAGTTTIRITIPRLKSIIAAGSGSVEIDQLTGSKKGKARVVIAGSGDLSISNAALEKLTLTIAGSGAASIAGGSANHMKLTIAGSGALAAEAFSVATLEAHIAGSGSAELASDGAVSGSIVGSGSLTIHGDAICDIKQRGSGQLRQIRRAKVVKMGKAGK